MHFCQSLNAQLPALWCKHHFWLHVQDQCIQLKLMCLVVSREHADREAAQRLSRHTMQLLMQQLMLTQIQEIVSPALGLGLVWHSKARPHLDCWQQLQEIRPKQP